MACFSSHFPQASTRLSKANLDSWILCVNISLEFSFLDLFNLPPNTDNVVQSPYPSLQKENGVFLIPLLVANHPQMNFTQMHERLRLELLRRVQRGSLSVSLLARQTGFGQPHLSNFLHGRRQLSLDALDRILAAQHIAAVDLLPAAQQSESLPANWEGGVIPVVSHAAALFEPFIRPSAVQLLLHLPADLLQSIRSRTSSSRQTWQRFVAVRITGDDALPMEPLVLPDAIALLDRHYTSLMAYQRNRPNLYAVKHGAHLTLRYVDLQLDRLVLRPHNIAFPLDLIEVEPGEQPTNLIAGRIALVINQS